MHTVQQRNTHSVPSWAELKPSNANAQRQANRKTSLCKHWIQARENGRCVAGCPPFVS